MSKGSSKTQTSQQYSGQQQQQQNQQQQQQQSQGQFQQQNQQQTGQTAQAGSTVTNNFPYLTQGWGAASDFLNGSGANTDTVNSGVSQVGQGTAATTSSAISALEKLLAFGSGGTANPANDYLTPFANGSMTGANNPAFQQMVDQIGRSIQPAVDGSFAASGRYGSGANANAFNSAMADEAGKLAYQDYTDSLNRQVQASGALGQNNATATAQALEALGLIPQVGSAASTAGGNAISAGAAPLVTFADLIAALGSGGNTTSVAGTSNQAATGSAVGGAAGTASGSASGNASGTTSGNSSGTSTTHTSVFNPIGALESLFSGGSNSGAAGIGNLFSALF